MKISKIITILLAVVGTSLCAVESPKTPNPGLKYYYDLPENKNPVEKSYDVVVYGGTPAGVAAAIQAKRMGKSAGLYVFRRHVGGLTSSGLTAVDLGKKSSIGGMASEFLDRIGKWTGFKSSEAEALYLKMLTEAGVDVHFEHRLDNVQKENGKITKISFENKNSAKGKMFIDATYEGDLLAKAGVSYMIGREDNSKYKETLNGFIIPQSSHVFKHPVDPYVIPGKPESGLIEGVSDAKIETAGTGDKKFQAFCFRMTATLEDPLPWPKPNNYRKERYELLKRYVNGAQSPDFWTLKYKNGPVKLNEGDCNNAGPVSIDYIGGNYNWVEASYPEREKIFQDHVDYQKGFMYFLANDESIPQALRDRINKFGLSKTEFPETKGWSHELYVREGRRMLSDHVMSEKDCLNRTDIKDSVGLASYTLDSHHVQRLVKDGKVIVEGGFEKGGIKPYPVSYKSIVPKKSECENLLVPVCLSSTHVAFGSIRMEPVYMILGQSAATAASMAIDDNVSIQDVNYDKLKEQLKKDNQKLDKDEIPLTPKKSKKVNPNKTKKNNNS